MEGVRGEGMVAVLILIVILILVLIGILIGILIDGGIRIGVKIGQLVRRTIDCKSFGYYYSIRLPPSLLLYEAKISLLLRAFGYSW